MKSTAHFFPAVFLWLSALSDLQAAPVYEPLTSFGKEASYPVGKLLRHTDGNYYGVTVFGGASGDGSIFRITPAGGETDLVHFSGISGPAKGTQPQGSLVPGNDGLFWGVTGEGGTNNLGTVFKFDPVSRVVTTVVEFTGTGGAVPGSGPLAALAKDVDGQFWGTTSAGGTNDFGTVFKLNPVTGVLTTMVNFTGLIGNARGDHPGAAHLIRDGAGWWWGTTRFGGIPGFGTGNGTVFKFHPGTNTFTTVVSFTGSTGTAKGAFPETALIIEGDGMLWGTTEGGGNLLYGTIFKINPVTGVLTTVLEATASTSGPMGPLWPDGSEFLWGVATNGGSGAAGVGSVFKINKTTGVRTTAGLFTGTGTATGRYPKCALVSDGAGSLMGSTVGGGPRDAGTIFRINTTTGVITTLFEFGTGAGFPPGNTVSSGFVDDGLGFLWGVNQFRGAGGLGTLFKLNPATGEFTTVVEFSGNPGGVVPGGFPRAGLMRDNTGLLWGTAAVWGTGSQGIVFKIAPATPAITPVVHFGGFSGINNGNKGGAPEGVLTEDADGFFWGTTAEGGTPNRGTVFKVNAATGEATTVKQFNGTVGPVFGAAPRAGLTADGRDFYWGTTTFGGPTDRGTLFKVHRITGELTTVVQFTGTGGAFHGREPRALLVNSGDGFLWGSTAFGGTADLGTIFRINTASGTLTTVFEFTGMSGAVPGSEPWGAMLRGAGGDWWGTTYKGGASDMGTIFRISAAGEFKTIFQFTGTVGAVPGQNPTGGALLRYRDGSLYGTTSLGGTKADGTIAGGGQLFRVKLPALSLHAGTAVGPAITDGQAEVVDFGRNVQGTPGVRTFTLINNGGAPLVVASITSPSGYVVEGGPVLPATVEAGGSIPFQISLTATAPQMYAGSVVIGSDDLEYAAFDFPVTGEVYIPNPVATLTASAAVINRQTGLREQTVHVANATTATVPAYNLIVRGLPAGVEVNNASSQREDGSWVIYVRRSMDPHAAQDILLEYFSATRLPAEFMPQLSTEVVLAPPDLSVPGDAASFRIDVVKAVPGGVLIEFPTTPGHRYQVQYSADGTNWQSSLPSINAVANRTQWVDRGLPRTESAPATVTSRFYRVALLP